MALAVVITSVLAGCASGDAALSAAIEGPWQLVEGRDGRNLLGVPPQHPITLTIEDDAVSGSAACNGYGATLTSRPPDFRLEGIASTEMACFPQEIMDAEVTFLSALSGVDTVALEGGQLLLSGPTVSMRFAPLPPVPQAELVATEWVLDTLLRDDTATTVRGAEATLLLAADGTLSGSTGCRRLTGRWVAAGHEVVVPELSAAGECPADLTEQDDLVVAVIGDSFVPEVADDRLTARSGTDGLGYRARP